MFRIVLFTSAEPRRIVQFVRRLLIDLPEVEIGGILYESATSRTGDDGKAETNRTTCL